MTPSDVTSSGSFSVAYSASVTPISANTRII
jgi:hypothetical protein